MWIAVGVLALVATVFTVIAHMHMFQLNSYTASTHMAWLARHRSWWIPQCTALVIAGLSFLIPLPCAIVLLLIFLIVSWVNRPNKRHAKKPLKYTPRVIRMLVTCGVLVAIIVVVTILVPPQWKILSGSCPYILSSLWVFVANAINTPIESGVKRHYIRDAEKILASQSNLIVIGITGSFGKTSVKYYLTTLLKGHFNVLMTPESYNTPMGITMTVRSELRATHEVFVCEMGAKRRGEIKADCDIVHPTIGVITAIGEQHLETFGSQEAILATKLELADAVRGKGMLYLNGDNEILRTHQPDQERQLYGLRTDNDTYAYGIHVGTTGTTFSLNHKGTVIDDIQTPLIGAHTIQNLAGAIAVALDLGVTVQEIKAQAKKLAPAPHRLAMSRQGGVTIIDDAYNSNPSGAKAALDTLGLFDAMKILITPGMVELGQRQDALNEQFGAQAVVADHVYLVGAKQTEPIARGLLGAGYDKDKLTIVEDVQDAIKQAYALSSAGEKVILLENDLPDNY